MNEAELRERAVASLERQRRSSILIGAYVVGSLALIAIWGLTGDGYFWPGWPMAAVALAMTGVALARAWSDREFAEPTVRAREAHFRGVAPPGIQR
jgi:fatty acid desaturase